MCEPTSGGSDRSWALDEQVVGGRKPPFARIVNVSVLTRANACNANAANCWNSVSLTCVRQAGIRSRREKWFWLLRFDGVPDELGYEVFSLWTGLNDGQQDFDEAVSSFTASPEAQFTPDHSVTKAALATVVCGRHVRIFQESP